MKKFVLLACLYSAGALAWGPTGHRVVGEVAQKFLTEATAKKVDALLKGNSLSRVANWPDEIKSDPKTYSYTFAWHYTDWPDEMVTHDETHSGGKLLGAIRDQLKALKDPASTEDQKVFAIKFLVHLVGDLHMPLHVGNGVDQGGNLCKVSFQGKATNLHSTWDDEMINFTHLSFTELAAYVLMGKNQQDTAAIANGELVDWALESKTIRQKLYPDTSPGGITGGARSYCRNDVPAEEQPKLSYEYSYHFVPVIEERLFKGGVRLARLLNENL